MEVAEADFVVVGAGSAGCVLAAGLSEGGKNSVLVLEAGPSDRHPFVKVPLGYGLLFHDAKRNYRYASAAEPELAGRELYVPRGKTVGGSGSINAMVYCRGMPSDFEGWKQAGLHDWGWQDVRPYFEANESRDPSEQGIAVTDPISERHPFTRHFVEAARQLGLNSSADFNGPSPEGTGFYHITTRNGYRCTSADAFLRPAIKQRWVRLVTNAVVQRIEFAEGRAQAVTYLRHGKTKRASARRAVVLAAGAINSPQLLQVSGIGDPAHLAKIGVETVVANPNVGTHLQDHLVAAYYYRSSEPTLNDQLCSLRAKAWQAIRYLLARRGPLCNSVNQFGGFVRTSPDLSAPDQQLFFNPATYTISRSRGGLIIQPDPFPGFSLCFQPTRPTSRGSVMAVARDVNVAPEIRMNAPATDNDRRNVVSGGRFIADVVRTKAIQDVIVEPIGPTPDRMSDDEILADFRQRATSVFHPCGTCRMGVDATSSVVDTNLKVHGLQGLHVADASVFPSIPSGNINAPTLMVARRAVDLILRALSAAR